METAAYIPLIFNKIHRLGLSQHILVQEHSCKMFIFILSNKSI